jgi:hypothetical protein
MPLLCSSYLFQLQRNLRIYQCLEGKERSERSSSLGESGSLLIAMSLDPSTQKLQRNKKFCPAAYTLCIAHGAVVVLYQLTGERKSDSAAFFFGRKKRREDVW